MNTPLAPNTPSSPGALVLAVSGDVDLATSIAFRMLLESAAQAPAIVIIDLSDVRFMDCSGLPPLLEAHARMGDRLQLRGLRPAVRQLLLLTEVGALFGLPGQPQPDPPDPPDPSAPGWAGSPRTPGPVMGGHSAEPARAAGGTARPRWGLPQQNPAPRGPRPARLATAPTLGVRA